jgi:hypothetical protein
MPADNEQYHRLHKAVRGNVDKVYRRMGKLRLIVYLINKKLVIIEKRT